MSAFQRLALYAAALAIGVGLVLFGQWVSWLAAGLGAVVALLLVAASTFEKAPPAAPATPAEIADARAVAEAERLASEGRQILVRDRSAIARDAARSREPVEADD